MASNGDLIGVEARQSRFSLSFSSSPALRVSVFDSVDAGRIGRSPCLGAGICAILILLRIVIEMQGNSSLIRAGRHIRIGVTDERCKSKSADDVRDGHSRRTEASTNGSFVPCIAFAGLPHPLLSSSVSTGAAAACRCVTTGSAVIPELRLAPFSANLPRRRSDSADTRSEMGILTGHPITKCDSPAETGLNHLAPGDQLIGPGRVDHNVPGGGGEKGKREAGPGPRLR